MAGSGDLDDQFMVISSGLCSVHRSSRRGRECFPIAVAIPRVDSFRRWEDVQSWSRCHCHADGLCNETYTRWK